MHWREIFDDWSDGVEVEWCNGVELCSGVMEWSNKVEICSGVMQWI